MRRLGFIMSILTLVLISCSGNREHVYHLYYLGGQSNMDGYGYNQELEAVYNDPFDGVYIYHGNPTWSTAEPDGRGLWALLRPGHGAGFSTDGDTNRYSNRFGVELSFAKELKRLHPGQQIAIIKYSVGGTSIDSEAVLNGGNWDPGYLGGEGINQYDHFLATVDAALACADIDGDGKDDRLIPSGIVWMQGESDGASTEEVALRYRANLEELMGLIREKLGSSEIPVVIGRISDSGMNDSGMVWRFGDIIRGAQEDFCKNDHTAAMVTSTDSYGYSDPWHYDSAGFIDLGKEFAIALDSLITQK